MADWEPPRVSTYIPFFRRFTDERARELEETRQLYAAVRERHETFRHTPASVGEAVYEFIDHVPDDLLPPLCTALDAVIRKEAFLFELPVPDYEGMTLKEFVEFRSFLRKKEHFFHSSETVINFFAQALVRIFAAIADELPQTATPSPFTIPFIYALSQPRVMLTQLYNTLLEDQYYDRGLFKDLVNRLYLNLADASDVVPYEPTKKPLKHAADSDLPLSQLNDQYLSGTPFHRLFQTPVPLKLTHEERFSHMHIVGGTGAGKTTLLENLILHDLDSPDPPSLVIIDSQGDLIRKISHLARFADDDRFILISPKDTQHPPALNIFDVNRSRLDRYDEATKEQVVAGVIQTFDYLFAGLLGADLTAKQGVFFKFIARLMLAVPEAMGRSATILDMMNLMEDPVPYGRAIQELPPLQRNFFERDFMSKTFVQTKEQIRYRLQAILENPTMARLFTSPSTKIDLFTEMNRGSVILVDTAKDFLKGASSHFGRIFISLVLQAVLERAALAERDRRPVFLIVDEAASYFDSNIDDLLTDSRKYRCGCVFAHQYLDQTTSSLRASLAANTTIKFASGVSMADARAFAPEMRTTADFIMSQPRLQFAAHIRNVTPQAVSIPVKTGQLERQPQLTAAQYERLLERNRVRVSLSQQPETPISPEPGDPDEEISREW